jgi:hypothetical protein
MDSEIGKNISPAENIRTTAEQYRANNNTEQYLMAVMICRDKIKNKPYCKNRSACM